MLSGVVVYGSSIVVQ